MSITARAKVPVIFLLTNLFVSIAPAGEVDARFDGKWTGAEMTPRLEWKASQRTTRTTVIEISQSGKVLNVLSGFVPGFYPVSPRSGGNILIYDGGNGVEGRKNCRLKLSADGNTFEETGILVVRVTARWYPVTTTVFGTFHRVSK